MNSSALRQLALVAVASIAASHSALGQCPSDLNADGRTDGTDLSVVLAQWGTCASGSPCSADLNGDGLVNGPDLTALLAGWGPCVTVPAWATLLEVAPDPAVVHDAALRSAILDTGLAWRVRDTATQIEFVLIPPGTYQRGCSPSAQWGCTSDQSPVHFVQLTQPFYLGRYEVTQEQWTARMGWNPSYFQSASAEVPASQVPNRPVEQVSWNTIQGFFLAATGMRLPTEAEWEYAYRAGTTTAFHSMPGYPNGTNDDSLFGNIAWWGWDGGNSAGQTRPVGGKAGNGFGLHDMSGNVSEWVHDWYGTYPSAAQTNPTGPATGSSGRVIRGGSWNGYTNYSASYRGASTPEITNFNVGFRVARGVVQEAPMLTSVSPASGPTAGGTTITLMGTDLTGATSVTVGGAAATNVQVVNATTVTAVTPQGTAGARDVTVATTDGASTRTGGFTYVASAPTLASVSPASGPTGGGTTITLTGTDLTGATSVTVGGVAATNVQVYSATYVTALTPPSTTGVGARDVTVTTPAGTASLLGAFTYDDGVPSWATLIEAAPDPFVVNNAALRARITATGLPWRVRDTATQIEMVLIPPGSYFRGCSPSAQWECSSSLESPVHFVILTQPFYLGRYEVTQAQWTARMGLNPSYFQSASAQVPASQVPNRPVERVSWNMIQGFLSATGMRLPTEAEWEYAYRAGTTTAFHSVHSEPNGTNGDWIVEHIAWFIGNSNGQTRQVGYRWGNAFGLHDMSGNVWEWVSDRYGTYPSATQTNPIGPATGPGRVIRGGSWVDDTYSVRSSYRIYFTPETAGNLIGFRVARTP